MRRYMGTITGISDLDPVRWKNSQWHNLQVGCDESTAGERPSRVSIWEIEVVTPFYICPPPCFGPKFPKPLGMRDDESDIQNAFKHAMPWLGYDFGMKDGTSSIFPGLSLAQWMSMQQSNQSPAAQSGCFPSMVSSTGLHSNLSSDDPSKLLNFQASAVSAPSPLFNKANPQNQVNQLSQPPVRWSQQQQVQQLLQNPTNQQQHPQPQQQRHTQLLHLQQPQQQHQQKHQQENHHHNHPPQPQLPPSPTPPQSQSQSQPPVTPQQQQQQQRRQQQQQLFLPDHVNNGVLVSNPNQNVQQPAVYSQLQQQQLLTSNTQASQSILSANKNSYQLTSLLQPQDSQFQQQMEQLPNLLQRHQQQTQLQQSPLQFLQQSLAQRAQQQQHVQQLPQQSIPEQQLQFQLQQKLQQQQQEQLLSSTGSLFQPQLLQQQLAHQQNQQLSQLPRSQNQLQKLSNSLSTSLLVQPQQLTTNQPQSQNKPLAGIRAHSTLTDGDALSCSTSPTNNCQVSPSNFLNRNHQEPAMLAGDLVVDPSSILVQELHSGSDIRTKHELPSSKEPEHLKYQGTMTDQLEASSSGTSYCLDPGNIQQNFSLPTYCLDGDAQSHPRNNLPFSDNIDGVIPATLLLRGYDSQKDLQSLLSNYGGTPRDIETELSTAAISSQSFGVANMPFKPACSNEVAINEAGVLSNGLWANQAQHMRTYTKVQKRGSVGTSIDVTCYKGYDELRHDLARMFGIEEELEDPQSSDWKLVYVDHENDILLVGDDPWDEFVSCVESIKILSSAEVQQMSLDGNLGNVPVPTQACSGTDSGNAWRHYDDNSAAAFNR